MMSILIALVVVGLGDRPGWVSKDQMGDLTLYFHKRLDNGLSQGLINAAAWHLYPAVVEDDAELRLGIMFKYTAQRKKRINPEEIEFTVGPDAWVLDSHQFQVVKLKEPEGIFAPSIVRFWLLLEPEVSRKIMDAAVQSKAAIEITLRENIKEVELEYPVKRYDDIVAFMEWADGVLDE